MKKLSARTKTIKGSISLELNALYLSMKKQGDNSISLGVGEPDFDTPGAIKAAAIAAIERGETNYVATTGIPELREAIAYYFRTYDKLSYNSDEVMVTTGGKQAIHNACLTILKPGDEIIIPEPAWFSFAEIVKLAGGKPVPSKTDKLAVTAANLKKAITPKTKAILINSPSNPTGEVIPTAELAKIAELAVKKDLYVISDEIYHRFVFSGSHKSVASFPGMYERTFTVNGVSKTYAMTGWRLGFMGAPEEFIKPMARFQSHSTGGINAPTQWGAVEALTGSQKPVEKMLASFKERRSFVIKRLRSIHGIQPNNPAGAFYVFPDISATGLDCMTFCERLLKEQKVVAIPGKAFGKQGEGHVRLSYANSMQNLEEALNRIESFVKSL
jgi:aspartate/methionine/tyrosine aminotransferase